VSLPIWIDRALDLACHEGYPGHHLYNALLERELVRGRGWPEFQIDPLFSPQSLIAEGPPTGIELAFTTQAARVRARCPLPLADLDPALALYARVRELRKGQLSTPATKRRAVISMDIDAAAAAAGSALRAPHVARPAAGASSTPRLHHQLNLGQDLVRAYVEARAAAATGDPTTLAERKWKAFIELISSPRLPSGLEASR
jgi:hypothetical protein